MQGSTPRIVKVGDFPGCPCGGTHVSNISDLVNIKVHVTIVKIFIKSNEYNNFRCLQQNEYTSLRVHIAL